MGLIKVANRAIDFIKKHPFAIGGATLGAVKEGYESENAQGKKFSKGRRSVNTIGGAIAGGMMGMTFDSMRNTGKAQLAEEERMMTHLQGLDAEMAAKIKAPRFKVHKKPGGRYTFIPKPGGKKV